VFACERMCMCEKECVRVGGVRNAIPCVFIHCMCGCMCQNMCASV